MFSVYVLKSEVKSWKIYIGYTSKDVRRRLKDHNEGKSNYTRQHRPWKLIYYESYLSESDARKREKMLKQYGNSWGHLKRRINESLKSEKGGVSSATGKSPRQT